MKFFAASGDGGYMGYLYPNDYLWYPAALPTEISAGGTELHRANNARGWTENTWFATGGGCSFDYPKPAWQLDEGCKNRVDNDASAVASPQTPVSIYVTQHTKKESEEHPEWRLEGGTSASSPLLAGIEAHASAFAHSLPGAEAFYSDPSAAYDVTEGADAPSGDAIRILLQRTTRLGRSDRRGHARRAVDAHLADAAARNGHGGTVEATAATLNGALDPEGSRTSYYFQYGTSATYGSSTATASAGSGTEHVGVDAALTGLTPGTTYHYRLVVTSGIPYYGRDSVFRTAVPTLTHVTPDGGSPAGGSSVTINGTNLAGVTAVSFGSKHASFRLSSETTIIATSPPGSGTVDVTVTRRRAPPPPVRPTASL